MISKLFSSIGNILSPLTKNGVLGGLPDTLNNIAFALNSHTKNTNEDTVATEANTSAYLKNMTARTTVAERTAVLTTAQKQELINKKLLTAENYKAIASELNLETTKSGNIIATRALTAAEVEEVLAKQGITGVNAQIIASNMGLTTSYGTLTASIGAATKAILTFLATNPIGWLISVAGAIGIGVTAYNALTDSAEETAEKVQELKNAYNNEIQSANSNAETIEELASRYEELSKGVNRLGENVSLTTDEYNEYVSLVNQIADMFPELVQGYDDEGNAILSLKGNVKELRDAYKEAQKEAYNLLIAGGDDVEGNGNDIIKDFNNKVFESQTLGNTAPGQNNVGLQDTIDILKEIQNITNATDFDKYISNLQDTINISGSDYLKDAFKDSGLNELIYRKNGEEVTNADLADIKDNVQAVIQAYQSEIDSALSDVQSLANAYLMTNDDYSKLDDELQSIVSVMINSIDLGIASGFKNKTDVGAYVQSVINSVKNNPEMQNVLTNLFTIEDQNISPDKLKSAVDNYINILSNYLGEDANTLKIRLGFEDIDELESRYSNAIQYTKELFGTDETAFFEDNSINTVEEVDNWLEVAKACNTAEEAKREYAKQNVEVIPYDWDALNEEIDSIQGAYQSIQAAQEEYNEHGYVSLDTLQALISLDSEYLSCLIDENGQLQLNSAAYQNLVQAKLAEAEASAVSQAIDELNNLQKRENIISSYDYVEANALLAQSLSALSGSYSAVMNSAAAAAQAQALSAAIEGAQNRGVDQADIENVISNLNAKLQLIRSTSVGVSESFGKMNNAVNGFSDSTGSASDSTDALTESLEKQKKVLEDQVDALEDEKEALEDQKEALEEIRDEYDALYDAIQWFFDEQIDGFDDLIDNLNDVNDALQEQLDGLDDILAVVNNIYGDEIDLIQEKIDALDAANDAAERELALEEAKKKLEEARNSRTILQYTADRGYIYTTDERAIKEAEDEVDEANAEKIKAELEDQIKLLEEMRDKWGEIPDAFEKAMQEMAAIDKWGPNYKDFILGSDDSDISDFQGEYTGIQSDMEENNDQIDYYEQQKEKIEELKELWEDAKNAYENAQNEARLAAFFGSDYEYELLNNSTEWSAKFAANYSDVSAQIDALDDAIDGLDDQIEAVNKQIEELEEKIQSIKDGASGSSSGGSGGSGGGASAGRGLSYYIWTDADEYALITAKTRLDELNQKIEAGDNSLIGARDSVQELVTSYEGLKTTRTNVEEVNNSLKDLQSYGEGYFGAFDTVIGGISNRLGDSANYTNQIVEYTWTAKNYVQELDTSIKNSADSTVEANDKVGSIATGIGNTFLTASQNLDTLNTSMDQIETGKGKLESGIAQVITDATSTITNVSTQASVAASNLQLVGTAMDNVTTGKQELEAEVTEEITDVSTTVTTSLENITLLKDALSGLDIAKQELETTVNSEVLDADTLVTEAQTKVTNINNVVNQLILVIEQLKVKLNELYTAMATLDAVTLSNVISIIGFAEDAEEASLLGAIQGVINKIIGEEGLVYQIQAFNENTDLTPVITQFNGEEASLLSAIQDVINIIAVDDDGTCLITTINSIISTITNINSVQGAFSNLESQVDSCINKVNNLKAAIDALQDKTITITTVYKSVGSRASGFATGTALTGFATGTAQTDKIGKSFYKGSGNWGLPYDAPHSMISELGPEILLRDGQYRLINEPQFIDLKKGDIIFNHEQTRAILNRGNNTNAIKLSRLGRKATTDLLTGQSFASGYTMVPYQYPDVPDITSKLFSIESSDITRRLWPNKASGVNNSIIDSIRSAGTKKDYNFGDINITMHGVNDTQSFALEIKKNLNSILRQID